VVVEPLCQGAAGVRIYPEEYLVRLRALCDAHDLLLIADEIAVGFGRTGSLFACERAGICPDIMTLGKGMTGGMLPMSVAMVTDRVYDSFRRDGERVRTFYDGHTFCGNPVTSAVALAALDVYEEEDVVAACQPRIAQLDEGMRAVGEGLPHSTVLTQGLIGVVEVHAKDGGVERAKAIGRRAMALRLFIRPLGPSVYLWPPLVATEEELGEMLGILSHAVTETA
jgi:adenosylmethionine-8-amino-7-oxononanoate aminotransferase